jgi:hypothetical protein
VEVNPCDETVGVGERRLEHRFGQVEPVHQHPQTRFSDRLGQWAGELQRCPRGRTTRPEFDHLQQAAQLLLVDDTITQYGVRVDDCSLERRRTGGFEEGSRHARHRQAVELGEIRRRQATQMVLNSRDEAAGAIDHAGHVHSLEIEAPERQTVERERGLVAHHNRAVPE